MEGVPVARRPPGAEDQAAVLALHRQKLGERCLQAQVVGIGGVNARDQGLHQPVERLAPSRRRTKAARLSSVSSSRRGMTRSINSRSLPRHDKIGEVKTGNSFDGAINTKPSGTGSQPPVAHDE